MNKLNIIKKYKNDRQEYFSRHKIPSGCAVFGVINEAGSRFSGRMVMDGISVMHERSNGLGGGFAAYGIYPQSSDSWAFHIFYDDSAAKKQTEEEIAGSFEILLGEEIPTRKISAIADPPIVYRYFLDIKDDFKKNRSKNNNSINKESLKEAEKDYIVNLVMHINKDINGAHVISSGKNMGIFKGIGFPEDIESFLEWMNIKVISGHHTADFPPTAWGGGEEHIPLDCWTGLLCITERFHHTGPIRGL